MVEAGELACYKSLIICKLLILHTGANAENAMFASAIHVEFTLRCQVLRGQNLRCRSLLSSRQPQLVAAGRPSPACRASTRLM